MRIAENYMLTHDIDLFCCLERRYLIHLASNGSILPRFIDDRRVLRVSQALVREVPIMPEGELQYNTPHINELRNLIDFDENRYFESFRFFAQKGFYSFDYEWNEETEGEYVLLVGPQEPRQYPWREFLMDRLPQVLVRELNERDRFLFERILNQIERMG